MSKWTMEKISLPLNVEWKISRGQTSLKENFIINFTEGELCGKGEVSFVTGAGIEAKEVEKYFSKFLSEVPKEINGLEDFIQILEKGEYPNNLKCGLETSYVDFLAQLMQESPQRVLGIRDVSNLETSMSITHMKTSDVGEYIEKNKLSRFCALKVKVTGPGDVDFLKEISRHYSGALRIDGNECFKTAQECLGFFKHLEGIDIQFVEQPLSHLDFNEYIKLRKHSPYMIFADESLQDGRVIDDFQLGFHGVNVKLSKAGGYYKAQKQLKEARELGLKTMLGCMVESSLGISCAMNIAHTVDFFDLDGFLLLKDDPMGLVYEEMGKLYFSHQQ